MGLKCSNRWKHDDRFVKCRLPKDEYGREYIPFCKHSRHIGILADAEFRFKRCEKKGTGRYCPHYERFYSGKNFDSKETLEVSVSYQTSSESSSSSGQ